MIKKTIKYNNIWMLSDIHMGLRSNSLEWMQNIEEYFNNFFIPLLKEKSHKNDICIFLGDIFDNRQTLDISIINIATDIIENISKVMPVHIICGNHDIYKKNDTDVNSLRIFASIKNVYIYMTPTLLTNGETNLLLLPWLGNGIDESVLQSNEYDYIFAHTDIQGFKYDNGKDIKKGLSLDGINVKKVFSGHIHKRQELNNWYYLGSPYHTKRSDIGNSKGVYMLDTSNDTVTFTPNTYSPIFQKIHINNLLELDMSQLNYILHNNYTDIIVSRELINSFNLTTFINIVKDCKYKRILALADKKVLSTLEIDNNDDSKSIMDLFIEAIDAVAESNADKKRLIELNKKYYELSNSEE